MKYRAKKTIKSHNGKRTKILEIKEGEILSYVLSSKSLHWFLWNKEMVFFPSNLVDEYLEKVE